MVFNSFKFIIFFLAVYALFWILPRKLRRIMLLLASYFFYMCWKPEYAILILASTMVDYFLGLLMQKYQVRKNLKKILLGLSLATNLGLLFAFKYWNFFGATFVDMGNLIGWQVTWFELNVLLPVGISFYTFQTLSYTIDLYRGKIKAEKNFINFALYVSFFPQLVAGPIERAKNLLPQIRENINTKFEEIVSGLRLVLFGFFKKMVIADNLAYFVNIAFDGSFDGSGLAYLIAVYAFAIQIYCDFSGYSDIAIGLARLMGFKFQKNFDRPYFSKSVSEFWRRWHISLSSWLKDYLYISLGGNRKGKIRTYLNLMITMVLGGLWHGASLTFLFWGALNGLYLSIAKATKKYRDAFYKKIKAPQAFVKYFQMFVTFHLICVTWIYFRAQTIAQANEILLLIVKSIVSLQIFNIVNLAQIVLANFNKSTILAVLILIAIEIWSRQGKINERIEKIPILVRSAAYCVIIFLILLFGVFEASEFIYFQF